MLDSQTHIDMNLYLFTTQIDAENYNNQVSQLENFKGQTTNWFIPIKHPNKNEWVVAVSFKLELVNQSIVTMDEWLASQN